MLIKNQIYEAVISDYTAEGQGVAKIEGCAVFIPNAIAGERVTVRIEKAQKTWAAGKIVEILERSPHRINRACPVAKLCGGCDFHHMGYTEETRLKAERVRSCLNRIGGENLEELPILSAPTCHGYRNKAQYPVSAKKGRAYAGFFRAGTHDVVENKRCLILPAETDGVKDAVMDYVNQFRIPAYDEVARVSRMKALAVPREPEDVVIAADTIVVCEGKVLGKPKDEAQAVAMLTLLSGRDHQVMTGCTVLRGDKSETFTEVTHIHFRPLSEKEIARYVASGEPMDKAGAYGIQGGAALFCPSMVGDYYNVMGLPLCRLGETLRRMAPDLMEETL